jgi:hypothetical protein
MGNASTPQRVKAQDEYIPRATVAVSASVGAPDDYVPRATVRGSAPDENNLYASVKACASCGYPMKPGDTECPVCGQNVAGTKKEPEKRQPVKVGTMIQGAKLEKETTDKERRKLTGFLVSYSRMPNGEFFPVFEGKNTIGRDVSSNVCIQDDSAVSDKHLSILYRAVDRKFKLKDEQSSNGTFINGELCDEGELKNLDRIRVGTTLLLFMEIPLSSFE